MKLDVRTKVLLVSFANLTFLFRVTGWIELVTVAGLLMLLFLAGRLRMAVLSLIFFLLCLLLDMAFLDLIRSSWFQMPATLIRASRLMFPAILAGSLLLTTSTPYQLMHGLRKWRIPESLLLTLAVMLRFLPTIREDVAVLSRSLKLRGIFLSSRDLFLHPLTYFEYVMIPLMMSLLRRVQDLTMASLTKGLVLDGQASESFPSRFRFVDWSVCLWIAVMTTWMLLG